MTSSNVRTKVRKAKAEKASLQPLPPRNRGLLHRIKDDGGDQVVRDAP